MKKAIVYLNPFETDITIEEQKTFIKIFCKKENISMVDEIVETDHGFSVLKKRGMNEAIVKAEKDAKIDFIVSFSFEQITKELTEFCWIVTQLGDILKLKTKVISASESNNYDESPAHFMLRLTEMHLKYHSENT